MVKDPEEAKRVLKGIFTGLRRDNRFVPTSNKDENYNCIAWAMRLSDRWVDTQKTAGHWWPSVITQDSYTRQGLIDAFKALKFKVTTSPKPEKGYDKVALYYNPYTNCWSHAARVLEEHLYHSKVGGLWDIHHSDGNVMHFNDPKITYGYVYCYVKRPKYLRLYSLYLSLKLLRYKILNEYRALI